MEFPPVALECPKCGARLEVTPDLETFACGYCGASVRVRRSGGTISLQRIEARLSEVERNTDRTAAELAIVRHEKDLERIENELSVSSAANSTKVGAGCGCGLLLAAVGGFGIFVSNGNSGTGAFLFMLGFVAMVYGYRTLQSEPSTHLRKERDDLRRRIAELQEVADGTEPLR